MKTLTDHLINHLMYHLGDAISADATYDRKIGYFRGHYLILMSHSSHPPFHSPWQTPWHALSYILSCLLRYLLSISLSYPLSFPFSDALSDPFEFKKN